MKILPKTFFDLFFRKNFLIIFCLFLSFSACGSDDEEQVATEEEYNILDEANYVRTKPKEYAAMLQTELSGITDQATRDKYNAAITTLNAATPCSALSFEKVLYFAACDHAQDLIKTNTFSHTGSNGSSPSDRVAAQAKSFGASITYVSENIAAGTNQNTGAKLVKQWVLSPGHLNNILTSYYTISGAALMSGHPAYNWISVQVFARYK